MKYALPSIIFLPFMIGKPVWCIWQGKVFQTSVKLVSPLDIHDNTPRVQCAWAHPGGYHILLYRIENSHRSRLININLSSYLTTSPAPPPCTTEACGHLSQEKADLRQGLFPGAWLTMAPHLMFTLNNTIMTSARACYSAAGMGEEHWLGSGPWRLSWQVEWTDHSCLWE